MSAELDRDPRKENYYQSQMKDNGSEKVNLNDLVARLKTEQKKERKSNIILSAAAISAVTVLGIILTL